MLSLRLAPQSVCKEIAGTRTCRFSPAMTQGFIKTSKSRTQLAPRSYQFFERLTQRALSN